MRKFLKKSILEIFQTLYEAHISVKQFIDNKDIDNAMALLADCQDTAIQIGGIIEDSEGEGFVTIGFLEEYCEALYEVSTSISEGNNGNNAQKSLDKKLIKAENSVRNDIKVRMEVVFCPYQASMWDSLESVWRAADADPDCDAYVVPIPYYDRNPDRSLGEFHYEGRNLPDYVPVTHYEVYNFEDRRPDVVYIHNPYDGNNYVTSVDPRFYSSELKKYADHLVYIPYFIAGYFNKPDNYAITRTPGMANSDLIVLQSETLKRIYISNGVDSRKIIVSGSPKTDAVFDHSFSDFPDQWKPLKERKVCLINSSISSFLEWDNFISVLKGMINKLVCEGQYSILWRPHPLLESTINSMRKAKRKEYDEFCKWFSGQSCCVKDELADSRYAIHFSDILLSDYSSLIFSYIPTEKPVIEYFNSKPPITDSTVFACDTRSVYYYNYASESADTLAALVNDVLAEDRMKNERMMSYRRSMVNCDGTCGKKTHDLIKKRVLE